MTDRNLRRDFIATAGGGDDPDTEDELTYVGWPWRYGPVPDSTAWDSGATCGVGGCAEPAVARLSPRLADAALTRDTTRYRCLDCLEHDLDRADLEADSQ